MSKIRPKRPIENSPASKIIELLGGHAAVAEILHVDVSRVYRWTYEGSVGGSGGTIPFKHVPALIAAAKEQGKELSADDFLPFVAPPPEPAVEGRAA